MPENTKKGKLEQYLILLYRHLSLNPNFIDNEDFSMFLWDFF